MTSATTPQPSQAQPLLHIYTPQSPLEGDLDSGDIETDSDEESITDIVYVSVPCSAPVRDVETGRLADSQWNAVKKILGDDHDYNNVVMPRETYTYMPKTYPGLSMFEEAAPMPYCDHEPENAREMLLIQKFSSKLRTVCTEQDLLVYTISDGYILLSSPPTDYIQRSTIIYPGHLHFHRNRMADTITLWMLGADEEWINCTNVYAQPTDNPTRHPGYPNLILSTRSDFNWAPCFISDDDFKKRRHSLGSLKSPLVQKVQWIPSPAVYM